MSVSLEAFVLAHEYGHAVLGHNDTLRRLEIGDGKSAQYYERSRSQEFEADEWAQDLLAGAFCRSHQAHEIDAPMDVLFAAPAVFMFYSDLLDHVRRSLPSKALQEVLRRLGARPYEGSPAYAIDRNTHPSSQERFRALFNFTNDYSGWKARQWIRAIEGVLADLRHPLDSLLSQMS